jgi:hypothetical protein
MTMWTWKMITRDKRCCDKVSRGFYLLSRVVGVYAFVHPADDPSPADLDGHSYLSTEPDPSSSDSYTSPAPLIFIIPHLHTFFSTIFTYPSPDEPPLSFAGATPILAPRTSGELDNAEQGQVPLRPPIQNPAPAVRIPGGLNDRGFW